MTPRLEAFLQPFVATLRSPEQQLNARHYVQGLLSDLDGKDVESIAYLHDRERQGLQKFIGQAEWFLTRETGREKKTDPGVDGSASASADRRIAEPPFELPGSGADSPQQESPFETQRGSAALPLATTQPLAAATA